MAFRHLSRLRLCLESLTHHPFRDRDNVFYIEILRLCHTFKESSGKSGPGDIKKSIQDFEVVIELFRRRKIKGSKEIYQRLFKILDGITLTTRNHLDGTPSNTMMVQILKERFEEIRNPDIIY